MRRIITLEEDYVMAEIAGRETARETKEFLDSVRLAAATYGCGKVLISVSSSKPLFKVEDYGISEYFRLLREGPLYRIALLGDTEELRLSHEYIELLARQQQVAVRSFRAKKEAVEWLRAPAPAPASAPLAA